MVSDLKLICLYLYSGTINITRVRTFGSLTDECRGSLFSSETGIAFGSWRVGGHLGGDAGFVSPRRIASDLLAKV